MLSEIDTNVFIGSFNDALTFNDGYLIVVTEEIPETEPKRAYHIPILKVAPNGQPFTTPDGFLKVDEKALDIVASLIEEIQNAGYKVLVHCGAGIERSPLTAAWFLMKKYKITLEEAYRRVKAVHPETQERYVWLRR
jgi:protein-tyrosine phosphatase